MRKWYSDWVQNWDHRLANVTTDRVVRPFEWGLEWTRHWPVRTASTLEAESDPEGHLRDLNCRIVAASEQFFGYETPGDFVLADDALTFTSPVITPYAENNRVFARWFPAKEPRGRAVVLLPHWNSQGASYYALCRVIARLGISVLRISLPYHDVRMPTETHRADYAVSSNICRTIDATRQAVIDVRSALDWLEQQGYTKLGLVGTSLGSCYGFLTSAHDARLRVNVFNHCSAYFGDVVWTGMATRHIREGLEGHVDADRLRQLWLGISPQPYIAKFASHQKKSLYIYAKYDTSFLPEFSRQILAEIARHATDHRVVALPCGHYTTGEAPYKYLDGFHIGKFLARAF